jgi:hypothetical protein
MAILFIGSGERGGESQLATRLFQTLAENNLPFYALGLGEISAAQAHYDWNEPQNWTKLSFWEQLQYSAQFSRLLYLLKRHDIHEIVGVGIGGLLAAHRASRYHKANIGYLLSEILDQNQLESPEEISFKTQELLAIEQVDWALAPDMDALDALRQDAIFPPHCAFFTAHQDFEAEWLKRLDLKPQLPEEIEVIEESQELQDTETENQP